MTIPLWLILASLVLLGIFFGVLGEMSMGRLMVDEIKPPTPNMPKFGFAGLCLLIGLVTFAIQQGCAVTGNAPSWIWGMVWFCLAIVLVLLAIWFWDRTASHHWVRKLILTLVATGIIGGLSYIPVAKEYRAEHIQHSSSPKPVLPFITLRITPSIFPVSAPPHSSLSILPLHPYQTFTDAASHLHIFDNPCGEEHFWPTQEEIDSKPKTGNEEVRSVEIINHSQTTIETAKAVFRVGYNDSFGGGCVPSSSPSAYQEDVVSIPPLDPGKGFQFFAVNQANRCAWLLPPTTIKVKIVGDEAEKEVPLTLEPSNIPNWALTPFPPTDTKWQGVPTRNPGYGIVRSGARCKLPDVPIETPKKSALEPPIKVVSHPYDLSANRRKKLLALLKPDEADHDVLRIGCMASSDSSCVAAGNFIVLFSEAGWKIDSDRVFRAEPAIPKDGVSLVTHLDKELPKQPPHLGTWQLMSPSQVKISKALTKMGIPTGGSGQLDMPVGTLGVYFGPEPGPQTLELQLLLSNCEPSSESCDILPVSTDTHGSFLTNGNVRQLIHAKRPQKVLFQPDSSDEQFFVDESELPKKLTLGRCGGKVCRLIVRNFTKDGIIVDSSGAIVTGDNGKMRSIAVDWTVKVTQGK